MFISTRKIKMSTKWVLYSRIGTKGQRSRNRDEHLKLDVFINLASVVSSPV